MAGGDLVDQFQQLQPMLRGIVEAAVELKIAPVREDLSEVKVAITGNGLGVSEGLRGRVETLEENDDEQDERLDEQDSRWTKLRWGGYGLAAGLGATAGGVASVIFNIAKGG